MDPVSEKNLPPKKSSKTFVVIITSVIVIVGSGVIYLGWRAFNYIDCGQTETMLPIPAPLNGAQIMFDVPMYYQIGNQEEETPTFQSIGQEIVIDQSLNEYYPGRFKFKPVSTSTMFSVIGAVSNANCGLESIDSGTSGVDFLILQDPQGNKSLIDEIDFWWSGTYQDAQRASYYVDGKRIGYVTSTTLPLNF